MLRIACGIGKALAAAAAAAWAGSVVGNYASDRNEKKRRAALDEEHAALERKIREGIS